MIVGVKDNAEQAHNPSTLSLPTTAQRTDLPTSVKALEQSLIMAHREIGVLRKMLESSNARYAQAEVSITTTQALSVAIEERNLALLTELAEVRGQLTASENTRGSEVIALNGQLAAIEQSLTIEQGKVTELERLEIEATTLRQQMAAALTSEQAKVTQLLKEKERLEAEAITLRQQMAAALTLEQAKAAELQRDKSKMSTEAIMLRKQLAVAESSRLGLQKEKSALSGQVAALRKQLATFERKLGALHKSVSWRITRPLRRVKLPSLWQKKR